MELIAPALVSVPDPGGHPVVAGAGRVNLPDGGGKGRRPDTYRKPAGTHIRVFAGVVFVVMLVAMNFALVHLGGAESTAWLCLPASRR